MKYLITGGCGFLGSNLADEVLKRNEELLVIDNLSRLGSETNFEWLKQKGQFSFHKLDIRNATPLEKIVDDYKPDVIFHLAGQVAMTTSLSNPELDFQTNVVGGHNVLEAARKKAPEAIITYSSTNKVYGDLEYVSYLEQPKRYEALDHENGFDEETGLDFQSPYGCSKGAIDQYMLDYARMFKLRTVVFRHSSIFGGRQFSTYDQGWIGWFVKQALDQKNDTAKEAFTISGNGKQVRDVLFSTDLVRCYFNAVKEIREDKGKSIGQAFNIGGGMENSLSLLELFDYLEEYIDVKLNYSRLPWRCSDQKVFVADIRKASKHFGWAPKISKEEGLRHMIEWVRENG